MAKKNTFFTEYFPLSDSPISVYFLLELKKEEGDNEILQRNIEENSNTIVQTQEQVAVSSITPVVKISTSLCSSEYRTKTAAVAVENEPTMKSLN